MPDKRKDIRPLVPMEKEAVTEAERFQNETLRPILKMQHDLLAAIFRRMMAKRRIPFDSLPQQKQEQQIDHSLSQDNRLRFLLLGAVIGQFTAEEYEQFLEMEPEATRRIMSMLAERLKGGFGIRNS
ncbi:MAG: glyoxalase [Lewinellaceae bacterium]|nr:glyoxalase [Lewinellaceae bacterium]